MKEVIFGVAPREGVVSIPVDSVSRRRIGRHCLARALHWPVWRFEKDRVVNRLLVHHLYVLVGEWGDRPVALLVKHAVVVAEGVVLRCVESHRVGRPVKSAISAMNAAVLLRHLLLLVVRRLCVGGLMLVGCAMNVWHGGPHARIAHRTLITTPTCSLQQVVSKHVIRHSRRQNLPALDKNHFITIRFDILRIGSYFVSAHIWDIPVRKKNKNNGYNNDFRFEIVKLERKCNH